MTNKPLILGVVTTLLVAGGQAHATGVCPGVATVMQVTASGFSCMVAGTTFSDFTITDAPSGAEVLFVPNASRSSVLAVSLSRGGGIFAPGTVEFSYMLTPAAPATIVMGTVGVDVPTVSPAVVTSSSMNGFALNNAAGSPLLVNSATGMVTFSPGVSSVAVMNRSIVITGDVITSVSNTFSKTTAAVPEPMSLFLFGLGLAGLALARRRRS